LGEFPYAHRVFLFALPALAQSSNHQLEAGGLLTFTFLEKIGTRDVGVGTESAGFGGRLIYKTVPYLDLETEINFLPGNSATSGNHIQGLFGAKIGPRFNRVGLFAKVRPGFMHFRKDPFGVSNPGSGLIADSRNWATSTEPSLDVGGVVEYYTAGRLILRFDLGDTIISYASRSVRISQFLPDIQAGGFTTHNPQGCFGIGFGF
jgi:hypothetical protein